MKKFLRYLGYTLVAGWIVRCMIAMVQNFGKYSAVDYMIIGFIMILPVGVIYINGLYKRIRFKEFYEKENKKINSLQAGLPIITDVAFSLGNDLLHFLEPGRLVETENKYVGTVNHSLYTTKKSPSLFRGEAYSTYQTRGYSNSQDIYKDVSSRYVGKIAITNKSLIFIHTQKGFELKIKDIGLVSQNEYSIYIQSGDKFYQVFVNSPRYFLAILDIIRKQQDEVLY
ncbi:MAG: hypothetical protein K0R05_4118 [Anaerocolumna sp.]|jgi:hypothetical protein|nr:hypothetical protein [Anaerocolumna sp.]